MFLRNGQKFHASPLSGKLQKLWNSTAVARTAAPLGVDRNQAGRKPDRRRPRTAAIPGSIGFLNDRRQRLLRQPPRLPGRRGSSCLPLLRDAQFHRPGERLPGPLAVAVALIEPLRAILAPGGAGQPAFHQPRSGEADHLVQQIGVGGLLQERGFPAASVSRAVLHASPLATPPLAAGAAPLIP